MCRRLWMKPHLRWECCDMSPGEVAESLCAPLRNLGFMLEVIGSHRKVFIRRLHLIHLRISSAWHSIQHTTENPKYCTDYQMPKKMSLPKEIYYTRLLGGFAVCSLLNDDAFQLAHPLPCWMLSCSKCHLTPIG